VPCCILPLVAEFDICLAAIIRHMTAAQKAEPRREEARPLPNLPAATMELTPLNRTRDGLRQDVFAG
jgi:hypothetical protein